MESTQTSSLTHVAIEAVGIKQGGGAHVLRRFVAALLDDPRIGALTLFVTPRPARRFELPEDDRITLVELAWAEPATGRVAWLEVGLARACAARGVHTVVCFNGLGNTAHLPQVNFIQQALMFEPDALRQMPLMYQGRISIIRALSRSSCRAADLIFVPTETIGEQAADLFDIWDRRIDVILPDIEWLDAPMISRVSAAMRTIPADRRVLYVGSDLPYKSIDTVVQAIRRVRRTHPDATLFLTLPAQHPAAREEGVTCLGPLAHGEVRVALEAATLLVMPSLAETIGLPMLEACKEGCPVLAADLPYAHEVCRAAAWFFKAGDATACAEAIRALLDDEVTRAQLAGRGRNRHEKIAAKAPYPHMARRVVDLALQRSGGS